ncbi:MAG: hypothetical protein ABMA13_20085 [Chthoniobacteraceae bacterium]
MSKPAAPPPTTTHLCAQRATLLASIDELKASLGRIDEQLIALGAGRYADDSGQHVFTVVAASLGSPGKVTFALTAEHETLARELAGDAFPDLFARLVTYEPKDGFADRCDVVLTPAKARKLIDLCTVIGKPTSAKAAHVRG